MHKYTYSRLHLYLHRKYWYKNTLLQLITAKASFDAYRHLVWYQTAVKMIYTHAVFVLGTWFMIYEYTLLPVSL